MTSSKGSVLPLNDRASSPQQIHIPRSEALTSRRFGPSPSLPERTRTLAGSRRFELRSFAPEAKVLPVERQANFQTAKLTLERFSISRTYSDAVLTHHRVATLESWVLQSITAHQTGSYKSGPARHTSQLAPAAGLEPATTRLTAEHSTFELRWNKLAKQKARTISGSDLFP